MIITPGIVESIKSQKLPDSVFLTQAKCSPSLPPKSPRPALDHAGNPHGHNRRDLKDKDVTFKFEQVCLDNNIFASDPNENTVDVNQNGVEISAGAFNSWKPKEAARQEDVATSNEPATITVKIFEAENDAPVAADRNADDLNKAFADLVVTDKNDDQPDQDRNLEPPKLLEQSPEGLLSPSTSLVVSTADTSGGHSRSPSPPRESTPNPEHINSKRLFHYLDEEEVEKR